MSRYYILNMNVALEEFAVHGPTIIQKELVLPLLTQREDEKTLIFDTLEAAKTYVQMIRPSMNATSVLAFLFLERDYPIFEVESSIELPTKDLEIPCVDSAEQTAAAREHREPNWKQVTIKLSQGFNAEDIQIISVQSALGHNFALSPEKKEEAKPASAVAKSAQPQSAQTPLAQPSALQSSIRRGFGGFLSGFLNKKDAPPSGLHTAPKI